MARGEAEQQSIDYIKSQLFRDSSRVIDFNEFDKNRVLYVNDSTDHFYGMSDSDVEIVQNAFFNARPNPESSRFPDFLLDNGFIEHFAITSSELLARGGSDYKMALGEHRKEFEGEIKQLLNESSNDRDDYDVKHIEKGFTYNSSGHTHEHLLDSLTAGLEKHVSHLRKYDGNKDVRIFLIEYDESFLHMSIDYSGLKPDLYYGDLLRRERSSDYCFSHDRLALQLLYEQKNNIDYVVFDGIYNFEIINLSNIPEICKLLRYDYEVHSIHLNTLSWFSTMKE